MDGIKEKYPVTPEYERQALKKISSLNLKNKLAKMDRPRLSKLIARIRYLYNGCFEDNEIKYYYREKLYRHLERYAIIYYNSYCINCGERCNVEQLRENEYKSICEECNINWTFSV